jgi:hypothetical protein
LAVGYLGVPVPFEQGLDRTHAFYRDRAA